MAKNKEQASAQEPQSGPDTELIAAAKELQKDFPQEIALIREDERRKTLAEMAEQNKPQHLTVKGFLLDIKDPFALGPLRVFAKAKKMDVPSLPYVLPESDPASVPALESYIIRAAGGGDTQRADLARAMLARLKK